MIFTIYTYRIHIPYTDREVVRYPIRPGLFTRIEIHVIFHFSIQSLSQNANVEHFFEEHAGFALFSISWIFFVLGKTLCYRFVSFFQFVCDANMSSLVVDRFHFFLTNMLKYAEICLISVGRILKSAINDRLWGTLTIPMTSETSG